MQSTSPTSSHQTLADTLTLILASEDVRGPSIGEITSAVGEKGFGLILLVLALPSALPIPAPGYSTPFGIAIGLIALQMLLGRKSVWIPQRLKKVRIKPSVAEKMLRGATKFLHKIERWIRPRQKWIASTQGEAALALVILTMACLMILPIPLTNTVPAMVIFLIGIGLAEEDGLLAIAAFAIGCFAVVLYAYIVYVVATQGVEVIDSWKNWIKLKLGMGSDG